MSRMFSFITRTWNPLAGQCQYRCIYCWAQGVKGLTSKYNLTKYKGKPRLHEKSFNIRFKPGDFVFISDMTELFAPNIPDEYIIRIFKVVENNPQAKFLVLTKNPERYVTLLAEGIRYPNNLILGATIESNRSYPEISKAPPQPDRLYWMSQLADDIFGFNTFISVEPILDFDLEPFLTDIYRIRPWAVAVGYDNYNNHLPEPPLEKTLQFIQQLEQFTKVECKTLRKAWYEYKYKEVNNHDQ